MVKISVKIHRIRSSSILEVVIAMVLIMVVFGIALTIFSNVTRSSLSVQKLKAQALAKEKLFQLEQGALDTAAVVNSDVSLETSVNTMPGKPGLLKAEVKVYSGNHQKIAQVSKLIKVNE